MQRPTYAFWPAAGLPAGLVILMHDDLGRGEPIQASDHLDAQVARPVAQQVLEVLVPGRRPEGGAGEQVLDPGTAEVEREEGVQLIPRPGGLWQPVGAADQGEQ